MQFEEQSARALDALSKVPGRYFSFADDIPRLRKQISGIDYSKYLLIFGIEVSRSYNGEKFSELQIQVEFDETAIKNFVRIAGDRLEEDPTGQISEEAIQQILGGSDPVSLRHEVGIRELAKIQENRRVWTLKWVTLILANTDGLHRLLDQLSAVSLTEQRETNFLKHQKQGGGAVFPYRICPDIIPGTHYLWTRQFWAWIIAMHDFLYDFNVPGVNEMCMMAVWRMKLADQQSINLLNSNFGSDSSVFKTKISEFFNDFYKEHAEMINSPDYLDSGKERLLNENFVDECWEVPPHCAIAALEKSLTTQETDLARQRLELVLGKIIESRAYVLFEKIPVAKLQEEFKKRNWPLCLVVKEWRSEREKPQWVSKYFPSKTYKENLKYRDCVKLNFGFYGKEHYFFWEENVYDKINYDCWPLEYRQRLPITGRSISNGLLIIKLIESGLLVRLKGDYELAAGILKEEDEELPLYDQLLGLTDSVIDSCCVPDEEVKLSKKLRTNVVWKKSLFAGDTESFIDPSTGEHKTSMLIIKGLYRKDIEVKSYIWNNTNPIIKGMEVFLEDYYKDLEQSFLKEVRSFYDGNEILKEISKLKRFNIEKVLKILKKFGRSYLKDRLKNSVPIIYFHHLGYDIQPFLTSFSPSKKHPAIKRGSVWYKARFKYMGREFELRNSLTIITTALKNFPKMFLPKEEQKKMIKEVYAYQAINFDLLEKRVVSNALYGRFMVKKTDFFDAIQKFENLKTDDEKIVLYNEILNVAEKPEVGAVMGPYIDIGRYAEYYCERDVDLLRIGLKSWEKIGTQNSSSNTFRGTPPFGKFDVFNFLSAPAIAQAVTENVVREGEYDTITPRSLLPEHKVTYKYRWQLRKFMLHCTTGGRCTLANEQRIKVDCLENPTVREYYLKLQKHEKLTEDEASFLFDHLIQDFDARSLYPTAMSRSFIPYGKPKRIVFPKEHPMDDQWIIAQAIDKTAPDDAMYLITDIKYDIPLAMPCNCWKQEKPEEKCRWTNKVPRNLVQLRKLTDLYTMIEVQKAHFKVLGGLEWREGKCTRIQDFMKKVYEFRRLNHCADFDHPVQESAKLVMNSFYGKNVTKVRDYEEMFFPKRVWEKNSKTGGWERKNGALTLMKFLKHNWRHVKQITSCGGSFCVKLDAVDNNAYDVNFGCEVLAGARALICRVSAAVEKITGKPCLYTDTDSLHLFGWQIKAISGWFEKKFGIPMIGSELGQFHPDFEPKTFKKGEKCLGSKFFCGVGKKMYCDELVGDQGSVELHRRAKGINAEYLSKEEYEQLFDGVVLEKDMDECGKVQIRATDGKNFSIHLIKQIRATADCEVVTSNRLETLDGNAFPGEDTDDSPNDGDETPNEDILIVSKRSRFEAQLDKETGLPKKAKVYYDNEDEDTLSDEDEDENEAAFMLKI